VRGDVLGSLKRLGNAGGVCVRVDREDTSRADRRITRIGIGKKKKREKRKRKEAQDRPLDATTTAEYLVRRMKKREKEREGKEK